MSQYLLFGLLTYLLTRYLIMLISSGATNITISYGYASIVLLRGQSLILQELNITANTTIMEEAILQGTKLSIDEYTSLFMDALKQVYIFQIIFQIIYHQITQIILKHIHLIILAIIAILIIILLLSFKAYRRSNRYVRI